MLKAYTVITGASEGIGRCFANALAAKGHNLVLVARNRDRLEALAKELAGQHGVDIRVIVQDLAEPGAAGAIAAATRDLTIDCLINNAGFQVPIGRFADSETSAVHAMIAVNISALTELTRLLIPRLVEHESTIVNVASHAAFQPVPYMSAYAATKAYVLHFTEALGVEVNDSHPGRVYVMALCPGATRTEFWSRSNSPVEKTRFPVMSPERVVATAMRAMARRRKTVVIPSLLLALATESLRLSPRALNAQMAKRLVMP